MNNPGEHIARVKARVEAGGHDVPEDKIRSRWEGAHRQLTTFSARVDHLLVYANERLGEPELVAEKDGVVGLHGMVRAERGFRHGVGVEAALVRQGRSPSRP